MLEILISCSVICAGIIITIFGSLHSDWLFIGIGIINIIAGMFLLILAFKIKYYNNESKRLEKLLKQWNYKNEAQRVN